MERTRYAPINLLSLSDLEYRLGESREYLRTLAEYANAHYSPFKCMKPPKPFQRPTGKPPKLRDIDNPSDELKQVQRKICKRLLDHLATPDFLYGAVRGRTIHDFAALHNGAELVVKMDIKNYYPSVTNDHVYRVWRIELGCSRVVANLLTRLTTFERHLPQGAPTSSVLANIYLASVFGPILLRSKELSVKRGAFVDDIVFSGAVARQLMDLTRRTLGKDGISFSAKKREVLGSRHAKHVTGIRDGKDGPRLPRARLSAIRAGFHKLKLGLIPAEEQAEYVARLAARVAYVQSVCPKDASKFIGQLDQMRSVSIKAR